MSTTIPFREIRAIYDEDTVRVYQAYSDEIAELAVAANSFEAPAKAGCWSKTRMTWIKPSAVWMAYRCGWSQMKDNRQARVLALDLSRSRFETLLMSATLSHGVTPVGDCKQSSVVVQWDPEREMDPAAERKQVLTRAVRNVRSIQIGLRGDAVLMLLDPSFVVRITDVTSHFRQAAALLGAGDVDGAAEALWPSPERPMVVPAGLRDALDMAKQAADVSPAVPPTATSEADRSVEGGAIEGDAIEGVAIEGDAIEGGAIEGDAPAPKRLRSWGERSLTAALPKDGEGAVTIDPLTGASVRESVAAAAAPAGTAAAGDKVIADMTVGRADAV
eukprot:CAMPEP_0181251608 /NCGR_PEP_ID=MMETSP1096-20121128/46981_1 /TAXON_ID=156174 ORGANISM="Chrysochromulina ericina, Strain CCMP281" /NCGR_SAMPLE_ID=MMETSP1096 /ASSEMBLY_ACC=CAM_ASM_000453 /LENGTH=331 /DNA_ID=CAMNT_0023349229 /DNA_START=6 /DNA_END=1001 /DNA_ORIENTATION=-